jgi:hypothetical protein
MSRISWIVRVLYRPPALKYEIFLAAERSDDNDPLILREGDDEQRSDENKPLTPVLIAAEASGGSNYPNQKEGEPASEENTVEKLSLPKLYYWKARP